MSIFIGTTDNSFWVDYCWLLFVFLSVAFFLASVMHKFIAKDTFDRLETDNKQCETINLTWFERVIVRTLSLLKSMTFCNLLKPYLFVFLGKLPANLKNQSKSCSQCGRRISIVTDGYKDWGNNFIDSYVVVALILSFLVGFFYNETDNKFVLCIMRGFITYIVLEMLITTLSVRFVDKYNCRDRLRSTNRSIILLFIGYLETILCFWVWFQYKGISKWDALPASIDCIMKGQFPKSIEDSISEGYLSNYLQILCRVEYFIGWVLIVFVLADFIGSRSGPNTER